MNLSPSTRNTKRSIVAWQRLTRVYQQIARREREVLLAFHLTTAQFDVLSHVWRAPGMSQQALAQRLLVTKGNICGLIDRLEISGLVERRPAPQDRRSHHLYLTETGALTFQQAAPALEQELEHLFRGLSEDDLHSLSGVFNRLEQYISLQNTIPMETEQ